MPDVLEAPAPSESMAALDNLFSDDSPSPQAAPSPAPTPTPAPTQAPAAAPKPSAPPQDFDDIPKPQPKPAPKQEAKPQAAPKQEAPKEPGSLKELRTNYETTKRERDEYAAKLKALEEARETGTKREVEKAKAELSAEIEKHKKRAEEMETEVKYLDYTRSSEFKETYHTPLVAAWKAAIDDIRGAVITDEDGTERPGTADDIKALVGMSTIEAARKANDLFGAAGSEMMAHRRAILDRIGARDRALDEWRTKGSEREAQRQRETEEGHSKVVGMWESTMKDLTESNRELFGDDEADADGNELLKKADAIVRLAFTGEGLKEGLTAEQRREMVTKAQANVAIRARAFGRERLRSIRLQEKVADLEAKLAEFKSSEPGGGNVAPDGTGGEKKYARPEDAIDNM
jgi:hypothetical protein